MGEISFKYSSLSYTSCGSFWVTGQVRVSFWLMAMHYWLLPIILQLNAIHIRMMSCRLKHAGFTVLTHMHRYSGFSISVCTADVLCVVMLLVHTHSNHFVKLQALFYFPAEQMTSQNSTNHLLGLKKTKFGFTRAFDSCRFKTNTLAH